MPAKKKIRTEAELAELLEKKREAKRRWYRNKQALQGKEVIPKVPSTIPKKERIAISNKKQRERRKLLGIPRKKYAYKRKVAEKVTPKRGPYRKRVIPEKIEPKIFENRVDDRTVEVIISPKLKIMVRPGTDIEAIRKKYANK